MSQSVRIPKYRLHRSDGRAVVTLNGEDIYLGRWNSKESRQKYDRIIAEWTSNGRHRPLAAVSIAELIADFWERRVLVAYRKADGSSTGEAENIRRALRLLLELYGPTPASHFGPPQLKAVRAQMIASGWTRRSVNRQISRIRMLFKWGVEEELVPASSHHALAAVRELRRGEAPEAEPVGPVPDEYVNAVLPYLSEQVSTMVRLQLATGMRPGEVCGMRTRDLKIGKKVWTYQPVFHKTAHHGHDRTILIGPDGQKLLSPFLKQDLDAFIFSPAEAEASRRADLASARKTPLTCGNVAGSKRRRRRKRRPPGPRYTVGAYRLAIWRACDEAFPPPDHLARKMVKGNGRRKAHRRESPAEWLARLGAEKCAELRTWRAEHRWHPNQLRHSRATQIKNEFGWEHARAVLGHRSQKMTQVYAEQDSKLAQEVMEKIG